jgi:O-antigen/teichoic acid export membrane protein
LNPFKKLLGQTAVYGLSSIVGRTLNYLLVPLYTSKFAQPSDYGVVSELYAWVAFLVVLLTFGMETTFFRYLQNKEKQDLIENEKFTHKIFQNTFWISTIICCVFMMFVFFNNQAIADAMLFSEHNEYINLLAIIVVIDAISAIPLAKLRNENKAVQFVTIQFSSIAVNIVLNLFFMFFLFDPVRPEEGVIMILVANLISSSIRPLLMVKQYLSIKLEIDWKMAWEMTKFSLPLVIAGFAFIINETIDRIMLKQMIFSQTGDLIKAQTEVGIYSACYKLAMLVTIFLQAYRYAAEPFFFSLANHPDKKVVYVKVMNYFIAIVSLVFLVVSLNIDFFKYFISNEAYWIGLKVVPILLLANVFAGIYINQSIWYKLSNQTKFGAYIAIGGACLTVIINLIFIPKYGYMASAWATFFVYFFQMIASYILSMKHYPIRYNIRKFVLYIGLALSIYFLMRLFNFEKGSYIQFIMHNVFILGYVFVILRMEKLKISQLRN